MYFRIFGNQNGMLTDKTKLQKHKQMNQCKDGLKSTPYASFDCPECIQTAIQMLEEELKTYIIKS